MRRLLTGVFTSCVAVAGAMVIGLVPAYADPTTVTNPTAPGAANAVQPAITSCPDFNNGGAHAVCFYNSDNFNNFLGDAEPSSCNIPRAPLPAALRNVINSVRNRTGCVIRLWYYCGTSVCLGEKMVPESEDGEISPINAIDEISYSTS